MLSYPLSHLHFHTVDLEDWSMGSLTQLRIDTVYQLTQRLLTNTKASFFHGQTISHLYRMDLLPLMIKAAFAFNDEGVV